MRHEEQMNDNPFNKVGFTPIHRKEMPDDDSAYAAGLKNDTARRGFYLFGLSFAGDAATKTAARAWVAQFRLGQLERGAQRGLKPFAEWHATFMAETEAQGVWTAVEIEKAVGAGMVDWWLEGRDPKEVYTSEIRPERTPEHVAQELAPISGQR